MDKPARAMTFVLFVLLLVLVASYISIVPKSKGLSGAPSATGNQSLGAGPAGQVTAIYQGPNSPQVGAGPLAQGNNTAPATPVTGGTAVTAIAIAVGALATVFTEYLRRSAQFNKIDAKADTLDTTTTDLKNKTGVLDAATAGLNHKTVELDNQSTSRSSSFNRAAEESKNSLEKTDEAVKDHAEMFRQLTQLLLSDPNLRSIFESKGGQFLKSVTRDVIEWQKDISAYYDKKQLLTEDSSTDSVIKETADTRKSLLPDYSGIPPTSDFDVENETKLMIENSPTIAFETTPLTTTPAPTSSSLTKTLPVANAGPDQTVSKGFAVTLDGTGSLVSTRTQVAAYSWSQTSGRPNVQLVGASTARATFTAPERSTTLSFSLTVTDTDGAVSEASTVTVTVR